MTGSGSESTATPGAVIVTGASRGIGAAIAEALARQGHPMVVNAARDIVGAEAVAAKIVADGGRAIAVQADISVEAAVRRLFAEAERRFGRLGGLVNNAGVTGGFSRVADVTVDAINLAFGVNVRGSMLCAREAVRRLSTARGGQGGSIVNISSLAARTASAGEWVHYAASKAAVNTFTVGLAHEVASEGIRVNAVAPGLIETDLHALNGAPDRVHRLAPLIPLGRAGEPEEVANAVAWLFSAGAAYVTGAIIEVGGGR